MNENSEPKSTATLKDSISSVGGLVLVLAIFSPILILIGIAKAITLVAGVDNDTPRGK